VDASEEDRWIGRADGQGRVLLEVDGGGGKSGRKKEATRPRWNWEEKIRGCDAINSILAESGWRERTPQKSWEGLKRAPHAPTSMIATRARVRAEKKRRGLVGD
jgi:hypothetical protein